MALAEPGHGAEISADDHLSSKQEFERNKEKDATVTTTAEPSVDPPVDEEYISGVRLLLVFVGVVLTCFLMLLDTSIIVTAIPYITSRFHRLQDVGWYGSAYLISSASLQPLTGKIYTYFSTKWTYLSFLFIFEIGSLITAVSTSSSMFIIGRAISGIGSSGLFNGGLTIIAASIPMVQRPLYTGILMACAQLGVLLGPVLGGVLTEYASWRWCFYINLPCGLVVAVLIFTISIPSKLKPRLESWYMTVLHKFDLLGLAFFIPAMVMLLLAVQWGGSEHSWSSPTIIGLFCGFGVTFIIFVIVEYRAGDQAMIPLGMMSQTVVWCSCLAIALLFANLLTTTYYLAIYFQTIRDVSPTMSGVYLLPTVIPMMIAAIMSGVLVMRFGLVPPFVVISGGLTAIGTGLLTTLGVHTDSGKWIGYQILGGFGRGLAMQMAIIAVQNHVPPASISIAMALVIFSQTLGGALFLSFDQTLFNAELRKGLRHFAPGIDANTVIRAGATEIRNVISGTDLVAVIRAFSRAIDRVFYLAVAAAITYCFLGLGMGWKNIGVKAANEKKDKLQAESQELQGEKLSV